MSRYFYKANGLVIYRDGKVEVEGGVDNLAVVLVDVLNKGLDDGIFYDATYGIYQEDIDYYPNLVFGSDIFGVRVVVPKYMSFTFSDGVSAIVDMDYNQCFIRGRKFEYSDRPDWNKVVRFINSVMVEYKLGLHTSALEIWNNGKGTLYFYDLNGDVALRFGSKACEVNYKVLCGRFKESDVVLEWFLDLVSFLVSKFDTRVKNSVYYAGDFSFGCDFERMDFWIGSTGGCGLVVTVDTNKVKVSDLGRGVYFVSSVMYRQVSDFALALEKILKG